MATEQVAENGSNVSVHYVGKLNDGTEFDSSRGRNTTLSFQVGGTQVIKGFSDAVLGMEVGEKRDVTIPPEDAYGMPITEAVRPFPRTIFPEGMELIVGTTIKGKNEHGMDVLAKIVEYTENEVTLDMNHPLAGETLNFEIELVSIDQF